jgi:DNA primase large subunit
VGLLRLLERNSSLLEKGFERLSSALRRLRVPRPSERLEEEVFSFYAAALLDGASGNRWVVSRLALAESERAYTILLELPDETVAAIGQMAGITSLRFSPRAYSEPIGVVAVTPIYRVFGFYVDFLDYIVHGKRLLGDDKWQPVNLPVKNGIVYMDKQRAVRLIKEALMTYIEEKIIAYASSLARDEMTPVIGKHLERLQELIAKATRPRTRAGRVELPKGVIVEEAFPPCMKDIYIRARRGEHLSHHERFAIATFLLNIGADVDAVVDVFRNMPDFKEKITRYQVEHLAGLRGSGKKYNTYSCEKMRSLGLCKAECNTRNPVQAYYRNLRSLQRSERDKQSPKEAKPVSK